MIIFNLKKADDKKGKKYSQLSLGERKIIRDGFQSGNSIRNIAKEIKRAPSTISRELKRNKAFDHQYMLWLAHFKALSRKSRNLGNKIDRNLKLRDKIIEFFQKGYSPQMISGELKAKNDDLQVSHETIYQWVYSHKNLYKFLISRQPYRKCFYSKRRRYTMPNRVSIHDRPSIISSKTEFGHYEGDTIFCKNDKKSCVTVILEKKSRYVFLMKNESKQPNGVMTRIINHLAPLNPNALKSITFDNGSEFSEFIKLVNKNIQVYFCDPGHPYQKGQVENGNRILRRFIAKRFNLKDLSDVQLQSIANKMNNLPRKSLNFLTPKEVFELEYAKINY